MTPQPRRRRRGHAERPRGRPRAQLVARPRLRRPFHPRHRRGGDAGAVGPGDVRRCPQHRGAADLARSAPASAESGPITCHRGRMADRRARPGLDPARGRFLVPDRQPHRQDRRRAGVADDRPALRATPGPSRVAAAVRPPPTTAAGGAPRRRSQKRIAGVTLHATDTDRQHGDGPPISGPILAPVTARTGRKIALDDVSGDGVTVPPGRDQLRPAARPGMVTDGPATHGGTSPAAHRSLSEDGCNRLCTGPLACLGPYGPESIPSAATAASLHHRAGAAGGGGTSRAVRLADRRVRTSGRGRTRRCPAAGRGMAAGHHAIWSALAG